MNPFRELLEPERPPVERMPPVEAKNEESLNLLNQMMRGVQRKR
jgi:hypothetical protein